MGKGKKTIICLSFIAFVLSAMVIAYIIRSNQLENEIENMKANVQYEKEEPQYKFIDVEVSGVAYTLDDFKALEDIPTVVDVHVEYDDGIIVKKQAYVSYSNDVESIEYIDDTYGRIIIHKE